MLGHSWGAMVAAQLPRAGLVPATMILLDPPVLTHAGLQALVADPTEQPFTDLEASVAVIRRENPAWLDGDVWAKALGLTQFDVGAVLAILLENGEWDGGLAALEDPAAAAVDGWMIRGVPDAGCLVPDAAVPPFRRRLGADHVITIADAPHSPQRTHPEATVFAILRALGLDQVPERPPSAMARARR